MKITKKAPSRRSTRPVRASRSIRAEEEILDEGMEEGAVEVAPEATELVFEAEDVAQLVAEVTGEDVIVEAEEDTVEFTVGDDVFTVEAEGGEELLESSTRVVGKKKVQASTRPTRRIRRR